MVKLQLKTLLTGRSRTEKVLFWSAIALVAYTLFGFFALPALVKYALVKKIPQAMNRQLAIDKISINPYSLTVRIQGFDLRKKEGEGPFVAFDDLVVNLQAASLFKRAVIVKSLALTHPRIEVSRHTDNIYSFTDLLRRGGDLGAEGQAPGDPLLFSFNNIEIAGGEIKFNDQPKGTVHHIGELAMAIPAVSNLPYQIETYVQPSFSALVNGTPLALGGMVKPFADSQETIVDLKMAGIDIPSYLAYIPNETGIILQSALVDLDIKISFVNYDTKGPRLSVTGEVVVREVEVVDGEKRKYLRLPRLTLVFADANLLEKQVHLQKVSVEDLALEAWRRENGDILPLALLATGATKQVAKAPATEDDEQGLVVAIDLFEIAGASGRFHDATPGTARPALHQVEALNLTLAHFSTAADNRADLTFALQLNGTGEIKGHGQVGSNPLFGVVDYELANITLKPYQPYVQAQVNVAVADGVLASRGRLSVHEQEGRLAVAFQGQAQLDKLALVDTIHGDNLLGWQRLGLEGIEFGTEPKSLTIANIGLKGLAAKLIIFEDGSSNIAALPVAGGKEKKGKSQKEGEHEGAEQGTAVVIKKVVVENGQLEFADRKVRPAYAAVLHDLNGSIAGLSSTRESQAAVDFSGKVNQQAPLAISGKINPLQEDIFVDLQVDFHDLDLSHASPYTGTYVGYKTEKGKLNLGLHYLVNGRDLAGENKLFLDQFTLGETVESPDDMNLPISLAIALLKDRQGEINLDIPVKGNLDDPEFSIGGVVFQVLVNLITKAATSPFALLGSLIPDGEDLQTVPFEPGMATITSEAQAKLDTIAHVLFERPGLRMDIMGQVDEAPDRRALAHQLLVKMMKLQKMQAAKLPQGDKAAEESVQLSPEEYERYLRKIFKLRLKASGATPAPFPQTVPEIEEYIVASLKVADGQLRLLAIDRANQALQYLAAQGGIAPERLFVVEPQALDAEGAETGVAAVRLVIK